MNAKKIKALWPEFDFFSIVCYSILVRRRRQNGCETSQRFKGKFKSRAI
jgi:hypothetical protein